MGAIVTSYISLWINFLLKFEVSMRLFSKKKNKYIIRKITAFALTHLMMFNSLAFAVTGKESLIEEEFSRVDMAVKGVGTSGASRVTVYTEGAPSIGGVQVPADIVRKGFFRLDDLGEQRFSEDVSTVDVRSRRFQEALTFTRLSSHYRRSFFRYLNESDLTLVVTVNDPRPRAVDEAIAQAMHFSGLGASVRVDMKVNPTESILRLLRYSPEERQARSEEEQADETVRVIEWTFRGRLEVNFSFREDEGVQSFANLAPVLSVVEEDEGEDYTGVGSLELILAKVGEEGARSLGSILRRRALGLLAVRYVPLGVVGAEYIAEGLRANRGLRRLYVEAAQLSKEGATALVQAASLHPTLESFFVSDRPSFIDPRNLREALGDLLRQSSTLQELNLSGNGTEDDGGFGDAEVVSLVQGALLNPHSALQRLYLNANNIGARGAEALRDLLLRNRSLRSLVLSGNALKEAGAIALAEGLRGNTTLENLQVDSTKMGARGVKAVVEALADQQGLRRLQIKNNEVETSQRSRISQFGDDSTISQAALAGAFETSLRENSVLRELDLGFNYMGDTVLLGLGRSLQTNRTLRQLMLSGNHITDDGVVVLGRALAGRGAVIEVLDLGYNDITSVGIESLAENIRENRSLVRLSLDNNNVGDEGSIALARAFQGQHRKLKILQLRKNNIRDRGAIALAYLSARNPQLRELFLDENTIGIPGGQAMGYALSGDAAGLGRLLQDHNAGGIAEDVTRLPMARLQRLSLSKNRGIAEGNELIARGMGVNTSLQGLELYSTGVSQAHIGAFSEALRRNRTLLDLNLGGNGLRDGSALALGAAVMRNRDLRSLSLYSNSIGEATARALTEQHPGRIRF